MIPFVRMAEPSKHERFAENGCFVEFTHGFPFQVFQYIS